MAGSIDVKVVISGQDQGAAAALQAVKRSADELGVSLNASTQQAHAASAAVGGIGNTTSRLTEASRAATGLAFEMEGLGRGGRFAALEVGRLAESVGLLVPGFGEAAAVIGIVATALASVGLIEEGLSKKQDQLAEETERRARVWQNMSAEQLGISVKDAEASKDAALARYDNIASIGGFFRAIVEGAKLGLDPTEALKRAIHEVTSVRGAFIAASKRAGEATDDEAAKVTTLRKEMDKLSESYTAASGAASFEANQKLTLLGSPEGSARDRLGIIQEANRQTREEYNKLGEMQLEASKKSGMQLADVVLSPEIMTQFLANLAQINAIRDKALSEVKSPTTKVTAASLDNSVELQAIKFNADQEKTALKQKYDAHLVTTQDYYARLKMLEQGEIDQEIEIRQRELAATHDPNQMAKITEDVRELLAQRLAIATTSEADMTAALLREHEKQETELRESLARQTEEIRAKYTAQVQDINALVATHAITKTEGASRLADTYKAELKDIQDQYTATKDLYDLTGDKALLDTMTHIAEAYNTVRGEAIKASEASSEFAKSIGAAVSKSFDTVFENIDKLFGRSADRTKALHEMLLSVVKDLEKATLAPITTKIRESITDLLSPGAKDKDKGVPTLNTAASGLSQAADKLKEAAAALLGNRTQSNVGPPVGPQPGNQTQSGSGAGAAAPSASTTAGAALGVAGAANQVAGAAGASSSVTGDISKGIGLASSILALAKMLAGGGPVSGPGTSTSDSIPARLSHGEHVLSASDVTNMGGHAGVYALRKAAAGGYADGGAVVPRLHFRDSYEHVARFAGGGAVGSVSKGHVSELGGGSRGSEHHITVALEDGLFASKIQSPAGEGAVLKVLTRNRASLLRAGGQR
jgi:hypothetical protein